MPIRVLHVASEASPFAQSGGLADVLGGLPPALAARGLDVAVMLPLYRGVEAKLAAAGIQLDAGVPFTTMLGPSQHPFSGFLRSAQYRGVTYGLVDMPALYDRPGGLYGPTGTSEWGDNHFRFGLLGKVAVELGASLFPSARQAAPTAGTAAAAPAGTAAGATPAAGTDAPTQAAEAVAPTKAVVGGKARPTGKTKAAGRAAAKAAKRATKAPATPDATGPADAAATKPAISAAVIEAASTPAASTPSNTRPLAGVDILHVHDWQASAAAVYARIAGVSCAIITTIHNLAFRGIFPKSAMDALGWPWPRFTLHDLEFYDQVSFLKGGMASADVVTTVSPSYAREILTPQFGEALEAFLNSDVKRLVGIVNGIDADSWNPAIDPALAAPFSATSLAGKATCRAALAAELGFTLAPHQPLIAVIARMTGQKGLDLVADIVPELHRLDAKLVVLGSGEPELEARFTYLAKTFSENVAVRIGFDITLSRRIYGGSDLFLMPSRFEPCGLGQLYAMRYGSVPIVHAVGGLKDTVRDAGTAALPAAAAAALPAAPRPGPGSATGFAFSPATAAALLRALERAIALFRNERAFTDLRRSAMSRDSSWTASAEKYLELYRSLVL